MKHLIYGFGRGLLIAWHALCSAMGHKNKIVCLSRQCNDAPIDFILIKNYLHKHYPKYKVVIKAKKLEGKGAYILHMLQQIYHIATSKAVVLDSYCIVVSLITPHIKVPVLQMWHALGNMKKFGYTALDTPEGSSRQLAELMCMHKGYSSVLISSMNFADDLAAGFNIDKKLLYESPLPRVDLLVNQDVVQAKRQEICKALNLAHGKKNIVYCPTFRKNKDRVLANNAVRCLADAIDFEHYNFIYKRHPTSTMHIDDERIAQEYPERYNVLYVADYVISDYSTVIYEAGLLKVPVFLYAYDWNSYSNKRGLNIDIEHDVPTLFTKDAAAIMKAIQNDDFDKDAFEKFIAKNISLPEKGSCTQRVCEHLMSLVAKQEQAQ